MKGLRMRRHTLAVDGRNDQDRIAQLFRVSAITTDHAVNFQALSLRFVDCAHEIDTELLAAFQPPTERRRWRLVPARLTSPGGKDSFPPFIIVRAVSSATFRPECMPRFRRVFEIVDGMIQFAALPPTPNRRAGRLSRERSARPAAIPRPSRNDTFADLTGFIEIFPALDTLVTYPVKGLEGSF